MHVDPSHHIVLTVKDIEDTGSFYQKVRGMKVVSFASGRQASASGRWRSNLLPAGSQFEPNPTFPPAASAI
jgi:catechol 2,3-dioxygenase-like lactoylglutathione lyase family enzyme